ncbi:hypothetical protein AVEN_161273-1 [Araneus ventricosus]|uniref:Uncharacterized protein n=1 Tax=Araneus ventricosus TaxID=182803 RepID=A0A4Y2TB29_ARAVE|nr:hypothetical protein AVEN_161273-1 [Araneus ventricosus]
MHEIKEIDKGRKALVSLFDIISMVLVVPSVSQSIESGIEEIRVYIRGATYWRLREPWHRFRNGDLPGASSTVRRDENHLVLDPGCRECVPKHSIGNATSNHV